MATATHSGMYSHHARDDYKELLKKRNCEVLRRALDNVMEPWEVTVSKSKAARQAHKHPESERVDIHSSRVDPGVKATSPTAEPEIPPAAAPTGTANATAIAESYVVVEPAFEARQFPRPFAFPQEHPTVQQQQPQPRPTTPPTIHQPRPLTPPTIHVVSEPPEAPGPSSSNETTLADVSSHIGEHNQNERLQFLKDMQHRHTEHMRQQRSALRLQLSHPMKQDEIKPPPTTARASAPLPNFFSARARLQSEAADFLTQYATFKVPMYRSSNTVGLDLPPSPTRNKVAPSNVEEDLAAIPETPVDVTPSPEGRAVVFPQAQWFNEEQRRTLFHPRPTIADSDSETSTPPSSMFYSRCTPPRAGTPLLRRAFPLSDIDEDVEPPSGVCGWLSRLFFSCFPVSS
ncbi:hypothetical protein BC832DRAFT_588510 [Gaertneriomyces semiglobifer]|nr:hypothetical protein BC832DRAFT_588510 [Gaertneriomyces semiglobifer]